MGIADFQSWLKKGHPEIYIPIQQKNIFDNIYIDMNHILHNCIYRCGTEDQYHKRIFRHLDTILANFFAKNIYYATDGPAVYAKVILQRKRRSSGASRKIVDLDPLKLTPGTDFMKKVDEKIDEYMRKKKFNTMRVNEFFENSSEPNEGEIKVFSNVMKNRGGTHLIVGNDADLVAMGMAMVGVDNIFILNKHLDLYEMISINRLADRYERLDFAMISIMMGNDYLPKLNYIKFETIWEAYNNLPHCGKLIDKNGGFNLEFLERLMSEVLKYMPKRFTKFNLPNFDGNQVKNYLEGLIWCLNMYRTGECSMYDYVYRYRTAPTPNDIHYYLIFKMDEPCLPESSEPTLSAEYYPLLLMPYWAKELVPKKYHKLMDTKLRYIYEEELCPLCKKFKKRINDAEDASNLKKKFAKHREIHQSRFDIGKIVQSISMSNM